MLTQPRTEKSIYWEEEQHQVFFSTVDLPQQDINRVKSQAFNPDLTCRSCWPQVL